ncbi:MAG TPA: hypothetical protein VLF62_00270 [Candidatus Saccharimonadales bacterium]|nr:hypothetical protein [Candidatus Saccharimonadales bacterium]
MAIYKIPTFESAQEEHIRDSRLYAQHVAVLATPVRKLAELGLRSFWLASATRIPYDQYSRPLFAPTGASGVVEIVSTVIDFAKMVPERQHRRRDRWIGGVTTVLFAAGASAVINHPDARIDEKNNEAHLVVPGANREAAEQQLRQPGQEVTLEDGQPMYVGVKWDTGSSETERTTISVAVRQEPPKPHATGGLTVMSVSNTGFDNISLLGAVFDMQRDFPVERGRLGLEEIQHMGNALLVAAHAPQGAVPHA